MNDWFERVRQVEASHDKDGDEEWAITQQLKNDLLVHRNPVRGLTLPLFDRILDWKLRRQRGRTEHHRDNVEEQMLRDITCCAFLLTHKDRRYLAATRLKLLSSLPGVGYGVASSIMTLVFPEEYAIIDFRVWKVIFNEDRRSFTIRQYLSYLNAIWECSQYLSWQPQKVDYFAWKAYEAQQADAPTD